MGRLVYVREASSSSQSKRARETRLTCVQDRETEPRFNQAGGGAGGRGGFDGGRGGMRGGFNGGGYGRGGMGMGMGMGGRGGMGGNQIFISNVRLALLLTRSPLTYLTASLPSRLAGPEGPLPWSS